MSKAVGGPPPPTLARPAGKESASSGSFLAGPEGRRCGMRLSYVAQQRARRSARARSEAGAGTGVRKPARGAAARATARRPGSHRPLQRAEACCCRSGNVAAQRWREVAHAEGLPEPASEKAPAWVGSAARRDGATHVCQPWRRPVRFPVTRKGSGAVLGSATCGVRTIVRHGRESTTRGRAYGPLCALRAGRGAADACCKPRAGRLCEAGPRYCLQPTVGAQRQATDATGAVAWMLRLSQSAARSLHRSMSRDATPAGASALCKVRT